MEIQQSYQIYLVYFQTHSSNVLIYDYVIYFIVEHELLDLGTETAI